MLLRCENFYSQAKTSNLLPESYNNSKTWNNSSTRGAISMSYSAVLWRCARCEKNMQKLAQKLGEISEAYANAMIYIRTKVRLALLRSSIVVHVWANQVGWGEWRSLRFKIGYSEPTRPESREGTSIVAESSRVFLGDLILYSDWRTKIRVSRTRFWLAADSVGHETSWIGNVLRQGIAIGNVLL